MLTSWGNKGFACSRRYCKEQCQVHAGVEDHTRPGWTTSIREQDSPWKSQSEWQRTKINGEIRSMVWPTPGSMTAKEHKIQDGAIILLYKVASRWYRNAAKNAHMYDLICLAVMIQIATNSDNFGNFYTIMC